MTITLYYKESGTGFERDFTVLSLRGLDDIDNVRIVGIQHKNLDGSISEQIRGFQRRATIDFGVVNSFEDRTFLYKWVQTHSERQIWHEGEIFYATLGVN